MTAPPRSLHDPWIAAADESLDLDPVGRFVQTDADPAIGRRADGFYSAAWTLTLWGSMSLGSAGATCANLAKPNSIAGTPR